MSGRGRLGGGSARHIRSVQSRLVQIDEKRGLPRCPSGRVPGLVGTTPPLLWYYVSVSSQAVMTVSGQASRAMREFWTEFAWAKGARLQGSHPVGQVGAGRASPPGMEKIAWQACQVWMAGWATLLRGWHRWVDSNRVTSNSDRREATGTNTTHTRHDTRRSRAGISGRPVRGLYCDKLPRRE